MKDIGTKGETNQVFHREVSILTLSELKSYKIYWID